MHQQILEQSVVQVAYSFPLSLFQMNDIFILVFFFSSIIISLFFCEVSARVFKPFANSFNACLLLLDLVQHFDQVQRPLFFYCLKPRSQYLIHSLPISLSNSLGFIHFGRFAKYIFTVISLLFMLSVLFIQERYFRSTRR